jgi:integrase
MASIEERKNKQGRTTSYRVVWRDKNGKKLHQTVKDLDSAQQWKRLLEQVDHDTKAAERALVASNSQSPPLYTVCEEHIDRLDVRAYTIKKYRGYVKNHLSPIGNLPIDMITDSDMIQWRKYMQGKDRSPKTIKNVHGFIHGVMDTAVALDYRKDNPCHGKYLPKDRSARVKATFLTMDEFNAVAEYLPAHNEPAFRFLISTGLRLGEMTALTVEDVQLDHAIPSVKIDKSDQEDDEGWIVGDPKSEAAWRTVSLAPSTVDDLRKVIHGKSLDARAFSARPTTDGPSHRTWQRTWSAAVATARKKGKLRKKPTIHDLRHSHASLMISQDMNLFELADRLGHESVTTTTKIYGHLVPGAHFRAASTMEGILTGKEQKQIG